MTDTIARHARLLAGLLTLTFAADVRAGGFELREGSSAAQGASLAGRTSGDRDVSFILANPAALRGVTGLEMTSGLAGVFATGDASTGAALGGFSSNDDPNQTGIVPSFAVGYRVSDRVAVGVGVRAPFGLSTEYSGSFIGSFDAVKSELLTVAVTPMIAVDVASWLTLGAGVTVQYADADLTNRVGVGPADVASVEGDDIGFGFTVGALADVGAATTVGASFVFGIEHKLKGEFSDNFISPIGPVSGSGAAQFSLPWTLSLGVTHRLSDRLRVMSEFEFTNWSQYDRIIFLEDATGSTFSDPQNYKDSFMVALGAEYDLTDALTIRGGVAYDSSPVKDTSRTTRVPDADRAWASVGLSYEITDHFGVDAAYTYIRIEDTSAVFRVGPAAGQRVSFESEAHVVGVNARYRF
jgi:long-chain fatty acid transport protein